MTEIDKNYIARLYHLHCQMRREMDAQVDELSKDFLVEGLTAYNPKDFFAHLATLSNELETTFAEALTEAEREKIQFWPDVSPENKL